MHGAHHPADMIALRESADYVDAVKRVALVGLKETDLFA
jgi:beta-N-acetylhexosaminidase